MSTPDEDAAWRAIVENYGEPALDVDDLAPILGTDEETEERPESDSEADSAELSAFVPPPGFIPFQGSHDEEPTEEPSGESNEDDVPTAEEPDAFVPPVPDLPYVEPRRLVAWAALVLGPGILLVAGVLDWYLPVQVRLLLVAAALGGFGYLLWTMSRNPRDPWDDGARV